MSSPQPNLDQSSSRVGMGSIPYYDISGREVGTTFRVWGPFASAIYVAGDFNEWSKTESPLFSEGKGFWSVDVPEARAGQKYRFVIEGIFITGIQWRTDPYCKNVSDNEDGVITSSQFNWDDEDFLMPHWHELVIYELHVASFSRTQDQSGSFSSIVTKLDILRDLGINAIQIMPICGFPGEYSLGYNPIFPFDVESSYGDPESFKAFIKEAKKRGIAVFLDVVYNHFGPVDLDSSLWRFDGWNENNKAGIYFYQDGRSITSYGDKNRPDYGRDEVRQFLRDNMLMWLEEYHIDGLRFDSTSSIRNIKGNNNDPVNDIPEGWSLMQWLNDEVDQRMPWKLVIAEDLQNNEWITRNTSEGGAGFDSQWGSFFYYSLFEVITKDNDCDRNLFTLRDAIEQRFGNDCLKRIIYSENHDEVAEINGKTRLPEAIWHGHADSWFARKRSTLAAAIVMTSPGIPMIFQGQELLEWGSWSDSSTLDWAKKERFQGIWMLYQSLIHLRRNWFNNTRGLQGQNINVYHINNDDKVMAYHRWDRGGQGDDVIIVLNMADKTYDNYSIGFPRQGNWFIRFNSDWNGFSSDFGNHPGYDTATNSEEKDGMQFSGNIGIGPYSALILSQ